MSRSSRNHSKGLTLVECEFETLRGAARRFVGAEVVQASNWPPNWHQFAGRAKHGHTREAGMASRSGPPSTAELVIGSLSQYTFDRHEHKPPVRQLGCQASKPLPGMNVARCPQ